MKKIPLWKLVSFAALVFSISGNLLVNFQLRVGFPVWIVSNLLWIAVNFMREERDWSQIVMFFIYMGLNVHGFIFWGMSNPTP